MTPDTIPQFVTAHHSIADSARAESSVTWPYDAHYEDVLSCSERIVGNKKLRMRFDNFRPVIRKIRPVGNLNLT